MKKLYGWLEEKEAVLRVIVYASSPERARIKALLCYPMLENWLNKKEPEIVSEQFTISDIE